MAAPGHHPDGTPDTCEQLDCLEAVHRGDRWLTPHLSIEPGGRGHFHHRRELRETITQHQREHLAELTQQYMNTPNDFVTAWTYLSDHPIFNRPIYTNSHRTADELTEDELTEQPHVEYGDGLRNMWVHVYQDEGQTFIDLEHGPHLWPSDLEVSEHPHTPVSGTPSSDYRLTTTAGTYEQAIIGLAAKVAQFYGHDRKHVCWWTKTGD